MFRTHKPNMMILFNNVSVIAHYFETIIDKGNYSYYKAKQSNSEASSNMSIVGHSLVSMMLMGKGK